MRRGEYKYNDGANTLRIERGLFVVGNIYNDGSESGMIRYPAPVPAVTDLATRVANNNVEKETNYREWLKKYAQVIASACTYL